MKGMGISDTPACSGVKSRSMKRKTRFIHKHHYILDKNSFGRCKCGATKQFPVEKRLKLRPSEASAMDGLYSAFTPDIGGWCSEREPNGM